jgi:hypothetical protein
MTSADTVGLLTSAPFAPFSVSGLNPGFAADPSLTEALAKLISDAKLNNPNYSFAVVDLTDDPAISDFGPSKPAYAGYNDTKYGAIASIGKLLPLYGSYQLRYDLRQYIKQQQDAGTPITDIGTLAGQVRQTYRQQWRAAEGQQNIPLIEKIFASTVSPSLDFRRGVTDAAQTPVSDEYLNGFDDPDLRDARTHGKLRGYDSLVYELDPSAGNAGPWRLNYFEQLRLMARWSNDVSAAVVIEALGFPYLWQLSLGSGLFRGKWDAIGGKRAGGKGGFFLSGDYHYSHWDDQLSQWGKSPRDTPVHSREIVPSTESGRIPSQGGTARNIATLLAALAQDRLVGDGLEDFDHDAHAEMRELLRKDSKFFPLETNAEYSPIGEALNGAKPDWVIEQAPWPATDGKPPQNWAVSKLGKIDVSPLHVSDAVLVRAARPRTTPTSSPPAQITAVLVGINRASNVDTPLGLFTYGIVEVLESRHPRPS